MIRSSSRTQVGCELVSTGRKKFIKINKVVIRSWFETWLLYHLAKLKNQPICFKNSHVKFGK